MLFGGFFSGFPRRFFGLRQPKSDLGAFALPPEIILMVAAYLNETSVISLALTCRALCSLCFPSNPRLNPAEKKGLLLLLEKDIATSYFCHYCIKLHRWHKSWGRPISTLAEHNLPQGCKQHLQFGDLSFSTYCFIQYHHARLVMNRHFYGPTHGLSLRIFKTRDRFYDQFFGVTDSASTCAHIVDNKLLVSSTKTFSHPRGDLKALRNYIETWAPGACPHLSLGRESPHRVPTQLPELAKDKTAPLYFAPCDQSLGSCAFCMTDYCIDISWRGRRKGCIIKVSLYYQLGDCRSPHDWAWRSMTTLGTMDDLRTMYPPQHRHGIVRDKWNGTNGMDGGTRGE